MDLDDVWRTVDDTFVCDTAQTTPAASVGVLLGDIIEERALGIADVSTEQPNAPSTLFEIGSITKPWTASVVMRLVEQGLLDLDAPVHEAVPDFRLADGCGGDITVRHLLSHTSGICPDTYDPAASSSIDGLMAYMRSRPRQWAAGSRWGYSNLGYVLLGRVIEIITGQPYARAMRAALLEPLGCTTASVSGEPTGTPRAVGYAMSESHGRHVVQAATQFPGYAPAGSTPAATANHVLRVAAAHVLDAKPGSRPLLTRETIKIMQRRAVTIEGDAAGRVAWGLGWGFWRTADGSIVIGHGGSTPGFTSTLLISPREPLAVVVLTNSLSAAAAMMRLAQQTYARATALLAR